MIIDLLSTTNYVSYNIKIANIMGLHCAIYLAELINLNNQQLPIDCKDSMIPFKINRQGIEYVTTLKETEQKELDKILIKLNVLTLCDDNESVKLNLSVIYNIIATKDELELKRIKSVATAKSSKPRVSVRQQTCNDLKNSISCPDMALLDLYRGWVDGVYANPNGFLSSRSISLFQKAIESYAKKDMNLIRKLVEIATINGYRDAQWAINTFEKDYKANWKKEKERSESTIRNRVEFSDEVF